MMYILGLAASAIAGFGAWLYWRTQRRTKHDPRVISLVALLRQPMMLDPVVLANVAGKAWRTDLGDGTAEGTDGFVVGVGAIHTIKHGDRLYLVNSLPRPYVEHVEAACESIVDLRIRHLFREHQACFSCDLLEHGERLTEDEVREGYRMIAKLLAEFLDENALLILVPETGQAHAINQQTEQALQSDDPIAALLKTRDLPVIHVSEDDPLMQQAVARAVESWPRFVVAFEANAGTNFSVKAPISHLDNTEFIWLSVTALEGNRVYGRLANEPAALGPLRLGSKVSVDLVDLNDWCYIDAQQKLQGGFTISAVQNAARRNEQA